jgi:hypothetical protein
MNLKSRRTNSPQLNAALSLPNGARFFKCALQVNPFAYLKRHAKNTSFSVDFYSVPYGPNRRRRSWRLARVCRRARGFARRIIWAHARCFSMCFDRVTNAELNF